MRIKENESVRVDFAHRKNAAISSTNTPYSNTAKYLGMDLDIR
jgi:hypothetical protein